MKAFFDYSNTKLVIQITIIASKGLKLFHWGNREKTANFRYLIKPEVIDFKGKFKYTEFENKMPNKIVIFRKNFKKSWILSYFFD